MDAVENEAVIRRKFAWTFPEDDFGAWWRAIHEGAVGLRSVDGGRLPDLHDVAVSTSNAPLELMPEHVEHEASALVRDAMAQVYPEIAFDRFWRVFSDLVRAARWAHGQDFGGRQNVAAIFESALDAARKEA